MTKRALQEGDIILINIYVTNIVAPKYIKQTLTGLKGEINSSKIVTGDVNTSLTIMIEQDKR